VLTAVPHSLHFVSAMVASRDLLRHPIPVVAITRNRWSGRGMPAYAPCSTPFRARGRHVAGIGLPRDLTAAIAGVILAVLR